MRFFLAVAIPEEVKLTLSKQLQKFVEEYPYFSYVPMDNYHITIQHFGEETSIEKIDKLIQENVFDIPPFTLYIDGAALFLKHQITLYLSFARQKVLEEVAQRIQFSLQIDSSNNFVPHLTFAKYKVPSKQQYLLIKKKLSQLELDASFRVETLNLYESIPVGGQAKYKIQKEYSLTEL